MLKNMGFFKRKLWAQRSDDRLKKKVDIALKNRNIQKFPEKLYTKCQNLPRARETETQDIEHATLVHAYSKNKLVVENSSDEEFKQVYGEFFWDPSYGHPWTIPNTIIFKNNYLIFKHNYFIFFLITTFFY